MNIRIRLKSGAHLDFKLKDYKTMEELYQNFDFSLPAAMFCGVIILTDDISYIQEVKL
ncbi:hypothetical protein Spock_238 [Bacillus phage Spock]|uniref:Uncharacterized protein n=1 Tax=Bacillus phage Spock TaxID=1406791 RepID=U5Q159_9CAUD|nr:hypothetical protein Spock_238 [Bacillus phage Spock]AGY48638.1 hypothetical protein Spock_238 [Bacillus phage Spock]